MVFEYSLSKASVSCSKLNKEHGLLKSRKGCILLSYRVRIVI